MLDGEKFTESHINILGVDPGLKGGLTIYHPEFIIPLRTPVIELDFVKNGKKAKRNIMDLKSIVNTLDSYHIAHCYLEQVNAMPGQGVTGMFRFGQNFGQWEGLLTGLGIKYTLVRPQTWKSFHNLIGNNKESSFELAKRICEKNTDDFKFKRADEGRAESTLIAIYGWEQYKDQ